MEKHNKNQVINILLGVSVFFIPLWPLLPPFIWAFTFIYFLFINKFKGIHFSLPPKSYLILFASFYLLYALGLLWSHDFVYGLRDVWIKIPMLLFPLFFSLFVIDYQTIRYVKNGFVFGCVLVCAIYLCNALKNYYYTNDYTVFFYVKYSCLFSNNITKIKGVFPAYFAMGLNLAILIVMDMLFNSKTVKHKVIYTVAIIFMAINIIQLSEKMALIAALVSIPFYLIAEAKKRKRLRFMLVRMSAFFVFFILILFFYVKSFDRFSQVFDALKPSHVKENAAQTDTTYYNSSTLRLIYWQYGVDMFKKNWLYGVGTGDIEREETKLYKANNFQYGLEHFETPPGQYIHVAIILGVFGLALLLAIYFVPFYFTLKYKNYLYAGFLLIYIINSITGTVLSATSVLLYGFFNSFLYVLFEREMRTTLSKQEKQ